MEENRTNNSLVDFVSMATSNLKHTLGRPIKPKRKVNHRKYLQRQLKGRSGGCFAQTVSSVVRPNQNDFSSVRNTQDGRHLNRNVQGKPPTEAVEKDIQLRPTHSNPIKQNLCSNVPEIVDVEQVMAAVRVPSMMNPVKIRKATDMLTPRAEPVKFSSRQDQNMTTAKHMNTAFYALNSLESQKTSSAELFEWFGPEFDDLLERWSEESSSSGRRTGSETSSAADPYSPSSDISDNGVAIEDVFYEQLMRFSSSASFSSNGDRSCTKETVNHENSSNQYSGYNGIEFFIPGGNENTSVLWTNNST